MLKKIFEALLVLCPVVFANWDGSVKKPSVREIDGKEFYEIATPENLAWFAVQVNKGNLTYNAILKNDIVVWEDSVDSETIEWTPIGLDEDSKYDTLGYRGIFDGDGFKISGIYVPPKQYRRCGFFGVLSAGAVVKNLSIENALIQGMQNSSSQTGGIAGVFNGDSIVNCEYHGTVKDSVVGGLVGWAERYEYLGSKRNAEHGHAGVILNSRNYGKVIALNYAGGLVGVAADGLDIISSENFGPVSAPFGGGLVGFVEYSPGAIIDSCANHADVTTSSTYGNAGGIVSGIYMQTSVAIRNTVNNGNVYSGRDSTNGFVAGGFVAMNDGDLVVENSVNNGTVTRSSKTTQGGYAGGFIGFATGTSSNTISNCVNKGFVDGKSHSGGFVGKTTTDGKILNSINEGKIGSDPLGLEYNAGFISSVGNYSWTLDGVVNKSDIVGIYAGGIVAYANTSVLLSNSVNEGNITGGEYGSYATRLGGLIAYVGSKNKNKHEIKNVVNRGNITYHGHNGTYSGGIIGSTSDSLLVIDNAINYGNLNASVDSNSSSGYVYIGGIAGSVARTLTVTHSVNNGNIRYVENGPKDITAYIGGIVASGSTSAAIEQSLNVGDIYVKSGTNSSRPFVGGIAAYSKSVNKSVNEGRVELVGNEQLKSAFVAGIAYMGTVSNCVNKGNLIHRWALKDSLIAAIRPGTVKSSGSYSISDTVMINGVMTSGTFAGGCNFVDATRLGIAADSRALTTKQMQTEKFAWQMNTCDGAISNSGAWSQAGPNYPVLADDSHHPIYKLTFLDSSKVIRVKTYTIDSTYTNMAGHAIKMPADPDPTDADEDLKFGYWSAKGKTMTSTLFASADDSLYAFYIDKDTEPAYVSFVVDGVKVAEYVLGTSGVTVTLPDAQKAGRAFLGWYDDKSQVGSAGVNKKFTAATTLYAKYNSLYYQVQFLDLNQGKVLQSDSLAYGDEPLYKGAAPAYMDYDFVGWTPEIATVTGDAAYFATFVDPNASSASEESSSSWIAGSSSSVTSSSSAKSSSSQIPMSSASHGADWVVDALGGMGNFDSTWSTKGWTLLPTSTSTGNTKLVENDDGFVVLQFWSNSENTRAYAIQAKRSVYLQKGHSYRIKGSGYMYDEVTSDTVYMGFMQNAQPYDVFYEYVFNLDGEFESEVYNHCDNSQTGAFYINGGSRYGGFAIQNVYVEEREIQCPGTVYASQIGYQTKGFKELAVEYGNDEPLKFVNESGKVAFTAPLGDISGYAPSNQWLRLVDFTQLTANGTYTVMQGADTIYKDLVVASNPYEELLKGTLKFYYYQRASMELDEVYAGVYARAAGHPDTSVRVHSTTGEEGVIKSPKGWYDAGDYGKYTVNAGITTFTLLSLYETYPDYFSTLKWNIPAEGNLPDLLAEIKYNLDWMLTMQAKDGGVYHKLTGLDFPGTVMPSKDDSGVRYVIGKSVTAAYDFAGVMAAASRVYKGYDAAYAKRCLDAAESAYRWAENHPDALFLKNPANIKTGAYEDSDASDEQQFAATQLYVSTGNPAYKKEGSSGDVPSWQNVYGLTTYAKSLYKVDFGTSAYTDLIATADRLVQNASTGFGVTMQSGDFVWGSNSVAANQGVWLLHAFYLTGKVEYYYSAVRALDYLVGKNPLAMSYVTGFGTKSPQNPHHRISQADGVKAPVPGMLVGGPQKNDNSDITTGCSYSKSYPATTYYDNSCSYATNEVAINWNAPLAYLAGALSARASGAEPQFAEIPVYTPGSSTSVASSSSATSLSSSSAEPPSSSSSQAPSSSSQVVSSSSAKSSSSSVVSPSSSSSWIASSSSSSRNDVGSSSSVKSSSSSAVDESSSSEEHTTNVLFAASPKFSVEVVPNGLVISEAKIGAVFSLMDMQGRVLEKGRIERSSQFVAVRYTGRLLLKIQSDIRVLNIRK